LVEAESSLRGILADSERLRDVNTQAHAHQCLAVVLSTGGRPAEAIPHEWRAFQLYEDGLAQMRVLSDLGIMLLTVGDVAAAERALTEIVRRGASHDVVDNAMIELMHCASFRRDRVGFERWREQCDARRETMPPNILVDALRIADEAKLHEVTFRIERIKNGLSHCEEMCAAAPELATEHECRSEAVREVSASLARLGS